LSRIAPIRKPNSFKDRERIVMSIEKTTAAFVGADA